MIQSNHSKSLGVTILGSTGSIGVSTLDVIGRHADRFHVVALTAKSQVQRMLAQCKEFNPQFAVMLDHDAAERLSSEVAREGLQVTVLSGIDGLEQVAHYEGSDYVVAAIVGAAGLRPAMAAAKAGKRILLANKEALVMAGRLFMDEVKNNNACLLPIDSEHNAIFQCMPPDFNRGLEKVGIRRILLTASGGPFRNTPTEQLKDVTPEQACAHPNWVMGKKISIDSATMMNKGLEVIEACWLFNTSPEYIQVVLHPQSVIHSMVEYTDGSVLAQLGNPDMRTPIAQALAWPDRFESGVESLDIFKVARLDFQPPDYHRFPCLKLAMQAISRGGSSTVVLNAANEIAVQSFMDGSIKFIEIANVIENSLSEIPVRPVDTLESVVELDQTAREVSKEYINRQSIKIRKLH